MEKLYKKIYKGYVKTDGKKVVEKFGNGAKLRTFDEAKDLESYAGVLNDDVIMIDIDDLDQSEKLMDIVEDLQLNCLVRQTTRGRHFLFKNSDVERCGTHKTLALGLTADIKSGKKAVAEPLKIDGKERFIEWDSEKLDQLPKWLYPVRSKVDFLDMDEGDGRNQALFNYILTLNNNGFSKDEARECIKLINKYVLDTPLSEDEIETITRDEAFPTTAFYDDKKFLFNNFAEFIKNDLNICRINGQLHVYQDGHYIAGQRIIEACMLKYIPNIRASQRVEVYKYLELICEDVEESDARYIAFNNGIYDIVNDNLIDFDKNIVIVNKIPWDYVPGAYSELVDDTLNKLACDDKPIRALLEEAIGYSFYRRNEMSKAFFLVGDGANGKSTFLDMLKNVLTKSNYSGLDLAEMEERFSVSTMAGKLANVGDDISDEFLQGRAVSLFKKVVSGNQIKAENKGQDPFFFEPYVKLYFSANSLARTKSKGFDAVKRRLIIVPFNAKFDGSAKGFDPYITHKLADRECMEYLVQLGVKALRRILENHAFTKSAKVDKELEEYELINNPILLWLTNVERDDILNEPTTKIHGIYKAFCGENGFTEMTQITFSREINKRLKLKTKRARVNGRLINVFVDDE